MSEDLEKLKDQPDIPPEIIGIKEEHPLKLDTKCKEKLMNVPRLELTSKLFKEGKLGDD